MKGESKVSVAQLMVSWGTVMWGSKPSHLNSMNTESSLRKDTSSHAEDWKYLIE